MLMISWCELSEGGIWEVWASEYQLTSNDCALAALTTEKGMKQRFNYMIVKLIKYNINNEYDSFSAVESTSDYVRTEKDKRETKKRKKTAFILS